jgi:hypothetical protein
MQEGKMAKRSTRIEVGGSAGDSVLARFLADPIVSRVFWMEAGPKAWWSMHEALARGKARILPPIPPAPFREDEYFRQALLRAMASAQIHEGGLVRLTRDEIRSHAERGTSGLGAYGIPAEETLILSGSRLTTDDEYRAKLNRILGWKDEMGLTIPRRKPRADKRIESAAFFLWRRGTQTLDRFSFAHIAQLWREWTQTWAQMPKTELGRTWPRSIEELPQLSFAYLEWRTLQPASRAVEKLRAADVHHIVRDLRPA